MIISHTKTFSPVFFHFRSFTICSSFFRSLLQQSVRTHGRHRQPHRADQPLQPPPGRQLKRKFKQSGHSILKNKNFEKIRKNQKKKNISLTNGVPKLLTGSLLLLGSNNHLGEECSRSYLNEMQNKSFIISLS